MRRFLALLLLSAPLCAPFAGAQVAVTANVPQYNFQVLAGSTRQINVNVTGGTLNTINWSVLSSTGGASATFTTPAASAVSTVSAGLPTIQVNVGSTPGNCAISGAGTAGPYVVSSTASFVVQAQSVDNPTKAATFLFNVCSNSTATLANGTQSVIVAPAYQQAYQDQPMTLQSWVVGCVDETGVWSITSQPAGGDGVLADTTNRDNLFMASVTGRYGLQYKSNCNGGTNSAIVYVSPNPMPSYASTPNGTRPHECYVDPALAGPDYEVGPGLAYTTISSTPALTGWKPGTIMRIHPGTYYEYYDIQNSGTPTQPIVVCGVADSAGNLPIMDGTNATAQSDVDVAAGDGMIILWPGPSGHYGLWQGGWCASGSPSCGPNYVSITGLHLRNANSTIKRYSPGSTTLTPYSAFTGCINGRSGAYLDISGNELDNCSLGLFTDDNANNAWATITQNLTFMGNHIQLAGDPGDPQGTHGQYAQTFYALFEGNKVDNPTPYIGADDKWRGVEGIFRYNDLGNGAARVLDLIENQDGGTYMTMEQYLGNGLWQYGDTAGANAIAWYQESEQKDFVYGNALFSSSSLSTVHYSDDQGLASMANRNGILYFYSNTIDNPQIVFDMGDGGDGGNPYLQPRFDARNNIMWGRTVAWSGVVQMAFGSASTIIMDATTNLMPAGTFTIATPIMGSAFQNGTQQGWSNVCPNACLWPLSVPLDPHLYGLTSANYLTTATLPYNMTTLIPPTGSAAINAGTPLSGIPAQNPVRWQFNIATNALTPRLYPLTIGAEDPASGVQPPVAATPTFSPAAGSYSSAQTVTVSTTTPSATIYYTTNGSTPTTSSTVYSGPITVSATETVEAIAVASGDLNSSTGSAVYTISQVQASTPTFNPAAGTYSSSQTVTISSATPLSTIYYTTNGSTPTTSSAVYSGPITVSATETVEALATAIGFSTSSVGSAAYTIKTPQAATPTFNPAAGTYSAAQTVALSTTTPAAVVYYTTTGATPTTSSAMYSGPITVAATETIEAIAVASGYSNSSIGSATYTINVAPPPSTIAGTVAGTAQVPSTATSGPITGTLTIPPGQANSGVFAFTGTLTVTAIPPPPPPPSPCAPFTDPFSGVLGTALNSTNWTAVPSMGIGGGSVVQNAGLAQGNAVYRGGAAILTSCPQSLTPSAQFTVNALDGLGSLQGLLLMNTAGNGYTIGPSAFGTNNAVSKSTAGVSKFLGYATCSAAFAPTNVFKASAVIAGKSVAISVWRNGVLCGTVTDTASPYTSGYSGIAVFANKTATGDQLSQVAIVN